MSKFKTVSENLPFYPDMKAGEVEQKKPFIGMYSGETILGDSPDEKERIPVYIFTDVATGEKFYCVQSYAIKKCVQTAHAEFLHLTDIVFRFEFKGKTTVNGKPFNQFTTGYCTLEDYNTPEEPATPTKKAGKK